MDKYMGFSLVDAKPMNLGEYNKFRGWTIPADEDPDKEGYLVEGWNHSTWSSKEVFEASNLKVFVNASGNVSISEPMVDKFIVSFDTSKIGDKTTIVLAKLANGYEIIETSSCVDPANYNEAMGRQICIDRIRDKVWELLGFLLQTAKGEK